MDLKETSKLMREQSNRHTQYPLFVLYSTKKIHVSPVDDYDGAQRVDEIQECDLCQACKDEYDEGTELTEYCDMCDDEAFDYFKEVRGMNDMAGVFLTEKACEDHIAQNSYHYKEPKSFVISAWRNPEMVAVMQSILSLTGDIPSHYK